MIEQQAATGDAVGPLQFSPAWLDRLKGNLETDPKAATFQAVSCASATAKALREGLTVIRMNNQP